MAILRIKIKALASQHGRRCDIALDVSPDPDNNAYYQVFGVAPLYESPGLGIELEITENIVAYLEIIAEYARKILIEEKQQCPE